MSFESVSFSNRYSILDTLCNECDLNDCSCSSVSLDTHPESDYVWNCDSENDLSKSHQLTITDSLQSLISCNDHINVHVSSFQQRPSHINDHVDKTVLNISNDVYDHVTSMYDNMVSQHFHSSQANDRSHISSTFSNESLLCSSVNMQPPVVSNVCTDNHFYGQDKSCTTDNELIRPPDQSLSVTSFQVSNNSTRSTTHDIYVNNSSSMAEQTASQSSVSSSIMSGNVTHSIASGQSVISSKDQSKSESLLDLGLKCKGFQIRHLNIQGLSNKIEQVRLSLQSENNQIHVFGLSESKLSSFHPDSGFLINGFQIPFRRDRQENAGGGVLVYVKDGVSCKRRDDLEQANLECIWLEIRPSKSKPFLIGNMYRPPNSTIQWNEIFEENIENVLREEKEIYLMGDINRDLLNKQIKQAWSDYMEPFGLVQMVSEATRVTPSSRTLIDHIYTNCTENVNSVNVPKIGLSDHFPISL